MRAIICVRHNMLMEARSPNSSYVLCETCVIERKEPSWFPIELALINHKDGAARRTWLATVNWFAESGWKWERVRGEK